MTRADIYLQVIAEKTGEPPERLLLALDSIKNRLNDNLDDEIDPLAAEHLAARLKRMHIYELLK